MELIALGRYGRYPSSKEGTSGYLIKSNTNNILIDLGSGTLGNLQKLVKLKDIDCIILSHLHSDHMSDMLTLRYMAEYLHSKNRLRKPIRVYMPKSNCVEYELIKGCKMFDCIDINDSLNIKIGMLNIMFCKMEHPVPTYGVIIKEQKTLFYTADTIECKNLEIGLNLSDVVLGDACILESEYNNRSPHIAVRRLAELTPLKNKLLLTHLTVNREKQILDEALEMHNEAELIEVMKPYKI